ncbi:flagellar protein FlaG [Rhodobium orientis]|uniref:hypothetical protein n=1 Tax=Rhodobium orientis TaxID=34017 RepID=UPI0011B935A6|nr:hypothetical protein [Rhodobium orientis]MBB4301830.1 flagellar protein FlaG [Rhodobium orientis]
MEYGVTKPPAPTADFTVLRRTESNPVEQKTDLPAEQTVEPTGKLESGKGSEHATERPARQEPAASAAPEPPAPDENRTQDVVPKQETVRKAYQDRENDAMVFRTINAETGEVVSQIPEESILRLRKLYQDAAQHAHPDTFDLKTA